MKASDGWELRANDTDRRSARCRRGTPLMKRSDSGDAVPHRKSRLRSRECVRAKGALEEMREWSESKTGCLIP